MQTETQTQISEMQEDIGRLSEIIQTDLNQ